MCKKLTVIVLFVCLLSACMSASSVTPQETPAPTTQKPAPTATLEPYSLTVTVVDTQGSPVEGAYVGCISGDQQTNLPTGVDGSAAFAGLPVGEVALSIKAQGYTSIQENLVLERGTNSLEFTLERDPYQLLPVDLCPEELELLYVEDFEDQQAQGWINIEDADWRWDMAEGRGTFLEVKKENGMLMMFYPAEFGNAVWHVDLRVSAMPIDLNLNWHYQRLEQGNRMYYAMFYVSGYMQLHAAKLDGDIGIAESVDRRPAVDPGKWQHIAYAYYDGQVDVWMDDQFVVGGMDAADPIETGTFAIRLVDYPHEIAIDNVYVCALTAPYSP